MVRTAVSVLVVLLAACSGRSASHGDASAGTSGDGGGGSSTGGSGAGANGGVSGSSTGGSNPEGGSGGTAPSTGGSSTTGGSSATGGDAGVGVGGTGVGGTDVSGGAGAGGSTECAGPAPGGCPRTRCPENQTCMLASGRCIPTQCDCVDGEWVCTKDCGGGMCVEGSSCTTPDPSGCERNSDCATGEVCTQPAITVCIPLGCACAPLGGTWSCREDCGGGVCAPPNCPMGCEPQPSGFCGDERVTWVCTSSFDPTLFRDAGCMDAGTQVPRYCCPPTFKPECQ